MLQSLRYLISTSIMLTIELWENNMSVKIIKLIKQHQYKAIRMGFVVLLVGAMLIAIIATSTQRTGCQDSLLKQTAPLLEPSRHDELKDVVDKVFRSKGYSTDPNCLSILTTYYINIGDARRARPQLQQLESITASNEVFSPLLGSFAKDLQTMQRDIGVLEEQQSQIETNIIQSQNIE